MEPKQPIWQHCRRHNDARRVSVDLDDTVMRCMALMTANKIRHLPVMSGSKLVGLISGSDLMKFIVKVQSEEIENLENYITDDEGGEG